MKPKEKEKREGKKPQTVEKPKENTDRRRLRLEDLGQPFKRTVNTILDRVTPWKRIGSGALYCEGENPNDRKKKITLATGEWGETKKKAPEPIHKRRRKKVGGGVRSRGTTQSVV